MSVETFNPNQDLAPVTLTEAAVRHAKLQIAKQAEDSAGVRLNVRKSGCSGYRYELDYVAQPTDADRHFTYFGLSLFVDESVMPLVAGTEIDLVQEGISKVIRYNNPLADGVCGCGESFAVPGAADAI